jgi:hypothetical protein
MNTPAQKVNTRALEAHAPAQQPTGRARLRTLGILALSPLLIAGCVVVPYHDHHYYRRDRRHHQW